MNFSGIHQRERRNPSQMYHPMHHSVAKYWTETLNKSEMKHDFCDDFINNFHRIPDPLKKNLADTLFTNETPRKLEKVFPDQKMSHLTQVPLPKPSMEEKPPERPIGTAFSGIGTFFTAAFNVLSNVMFRTRSPDNYYDCFDADKHQGSPHNWQDAKTAEQDKNGQADDRKSCGASPNPNVCPDMNIDSRVTVTRAENKLNQVLSLLSPKPQSNPTWVRKRPKKVFIEPGTVEENFEDAFTIENFDNLPNDSYVEYYSPAQYHLEERYEAAAQKTQLNTAPVEDNTDKDVTNKSDLELKKDESLSEKGNVLLETDKTEVENLNLPLENKKQVILGNLKTEKIDTQLEKVSLDSDKQHLENNVPREKLETTGSEKPSNLQLVSSCEDKLSKLKALLREKRMKCNKSDKDVTSSVMADHDTARITPPKTIPVEKKSADKRFKNPNRRCSKRSKSNLKCRIEDDLVFANEISVGTPPSVENSPLQHTDVSFGDYFDEVSGRFRSASVGSEDSFQIVFNDSPKTTNCCHIHTVSDCDSEDSFIVFEDSPDSCYMTNDVFGDTEDSDSEGEVSDSGCGMVTCKLAHTLTRTVGNLADNSLYVESEDEVDFAHSETVSDVPEEKKGGLLLDDAKKQLRKFQPAKQVRFSTSPPKVHVMRVWAFAARQARAGHWERYAVDRERFKRRIADVDMAVSWVLQPQHRRRVMFQRFMPWWNQIKRKELAEKKEREAEKKKEDDRRDEEERQKANRLDGSEVDDDSNEESGVDKGESSRTVETNVNKDQNASTLVRQRSRRDSEDDNKLLEYYNNNKFVYRHDDDDDDGKFPSNFHVETDNEEVQENTQKEDKEDQEREVKNERISS